MTTRFVSSNVIQAINRNVSSSLSLLVALLLHNDCRCIPQVCTELKLHFCNDKHDAVIQQSEISLIWHGCCLTLKYWLVKIYICQILTITEITCRQLLMLWAATDGLCSVCQIGWAGQFLLMHSIVSRLYWMSDRFGNRFVCRMWWTCFGGLHSMS